MQSLICLPVITNTPGCRISTLSNFIENTKTFCLSINTQASISVTLQWLFDRYFPYTSRAKTAMVFECAVVLNILFRCLIVRADTHQEDGNTTARDHINKVCKRKRCNWDVMTDTTTGHWDKEDAEWKGAALDLLLLAWWKLNCGEKRAEEADRSRESFNPTVNEAEECGRSRESILRLCQSSELAAHKYPINEIVSSWKFYEEGLGLQDDEVGIMHPRWRVEFV